MQKRLFTTACVAVLVFLSSLAIAAEKPAAPSLAGSYSGTWKGPSNSQGDLRFTLKQGAAQWTAEAVFTYENVEVPTKMKTVTVDGAKVVMVFDWKIEDSPGESTLSGEFAEGKLSGTYRTQTETPSSGTWSATRTEKAK